MTNPVDEEDDEIIEPVAEDVEVPEVEEEIPTEDEKPAAARKKVAALKARHELEDFFEMKKIRDALDYLYDDESGEKLKDQK